MVQLIFPCFICYIGVLDIFLVNLDADMIPQRHFREMWNSLILLFPALIFSALSRFISYLNFVLVIMAFV